MAGAEPRFRLRRGVTLRQHAARGTLINGSFMAGLTSLTFLKGFVLAAFLSPADYGIWGILLISLGGLALAQADRDLRQVHPAGRRRPGTRVPPCVHDGTDRQRDPAGAPAGRGPAHGVRVRQRRTAAPRLRAVPADPGGSAPGAALGAVPPAWSSPSNASTSRSTLSWPSSPPWPSRSPGPATGPSSSAS